MAETLSCSRCKLSQPEVEFYPAPRFTRGYMYWCIACLRAYKKEPPAMAHARLRSQRRRARRVAARQPVAD